LAKGKGRFSPEEILTPSPAASLQSAPNGSANDGEDCYHYRVFNFGRPKTAGQWIGHFAMAIIALFLVWWMLRVYAH
jgi:hypothetical protein